jgi:signal peptidase I
VAETRLSGQLVSHNLTAGMNLKWFWSRTVRRANRLRKVVAVHLAAQRDLLSPEASEAVGAASAELQRVSRGSFDKAVVQEKMAALDAVAQKYLRVHPHSGLRENIEVLLVACVVAIGIKTFFLGFFKIPTGSMQPTLYGVTSNPDFSRFVPFVPELKPVPDFEMPNPVMRILKFWWSGVSYAHVRARASGSLQGYDPVPKRFLVFNLKQSFRVGDETYTVWFPPDNLLKRAGLLNYFDQPNSREFQAGEDIIKLEYISGDHLMIDRVSYNFRRPRRGDIIVFETLGIEGLPQGEFYIKRLVALGPEQVQIGNDRHLVINGTNRLDSKTPGFEKVYSFPARRDPMESVYSGHLNERIANYYGLTKLAPLFSNEVTVVTVTPHHYMVMGDNTVNSLDSRSWGEFPRERVIGRSLFVYWPFGSQNGRESRFGLITR